MAMIRPSWSRLGPNISVNTIIGLPFIKGVGMIIDTVDDMAE